MTSRRIAIATDSVCDLPGDLAKALGIHVLPTYVNIGSRSLADDGVALDRARFYQELPGMRQHPTTAAPSPGDAEQFYRQIIAAGCEQIISIHVPANLSGLMNAMRLGAEAADPDRVTLVDSLQLSLGLGFQALVAAELAAANAERGEILAAIEKARRHSRVYAIIDTLEYLRRSGRVNALVASFGSLLRIKPMIEVSGGEIHSIARMRTWSRALRRLSDLTRAQAPLERLAVLHASNRAGARRFLESLGDIAPQDAMIVEVSPTLGAHIGPGALGVATLNQNWRQ